MLIPGILYIILFQFLPMVYAVIAFKDFRIFRGVWDSPWVGFHHFITFFQSPSFGRVMGNTITISLMHIVFGFPIPIIFALMLNEVRVSAYKRTIQTIAYLPHFLSWVVIAGFVNTIVSPTDGVLNLLLNQLGFDSIFFMGDNRYFRGVLVVSNIWREMGWSAIIYLAALAGIPLEMYEAATIDGSSKLQKLFYITLPSLIPTITILLLLRMGGILHAGFEQIFVMYNPRVYATADIIDTYVFRVGIQNTDFGFATAVGLFRSVIAFFMLTIFNLLARKFGQDSLF